ncbi:MAG: hypothetical protein ACP5KW_09310 [Thermoproteota archaeon]
MSAKVLSTLKSIIELLKVNIKTIIQYWSLWWIVYVPNEILSISLGLASWYFYTKFTTTNVEQYFAFLLIGMAFSPFLTDAIYLPYRNLLYLYSGTIASYGVRMTPWSFYYLSGRSRLETIVSTEVINYFFRVTLLLVYFFSGIFIFGLKLSSNANVLGAIILFFLCYFANLFLGLILSTSFWFFIYEPQAATRNPLLWLFMTLPNLVAGVYYPIDVLPHELRLIGRMFPVYYALEGIRKALLFGYSLAELFDYCEVLLIFILILLPLGIFLFRFSERYAIIKARRI